MCPSYMVTREEKHSTRGRARLLWEMLNGEVLETAGAMKQFMTRSISVWLAKVARPIARSMWTWQHTRPSSSLIIIRADSGRSMLTHLG